MKIPEPALVADPKRDMYWLKDDYRIYLPTANRGIEVDAGVYTDGASIPRLFWVIVGHPFEPDVIAAAFVHDMVYCAELFPRAVCDAIFRDLLLRTVSKTKAFTMFWAVRAFGWTVWRKHTVAGVIEARLMVRVIPDGVPPTRRVDANAETQRIEPLMDANVHQSGATP